MTCAAPLWLLGTADAVLWIHLSSVLTAALILAGLWTPLAAACHGVLQVALAFSGETSMSAHLILAMTALSLVMLGPGAWSVDARLYGRKRIDLGPP